MRSDCHQKERSAQNKAARTKSTFNSSPPEAGIARNHLGAPILLYSSLSIPPRAKRGLLGPRVLTLSGRMPTFNSTPREAGIASGNRRRRRAAGSRLSIPPRPKRGLLGPFNPAPFGLHP